VYWVLAIIAGAVAAYLVVSPFFATDPIATETVKSGRVERILAAVGRIKPRESVTVLSRVAGQISRLSKDEGDTVAAGDILAELDDRIPRAALAQADAALAAARNSLSQAERDFVRATELRRKGAGTQAQLEQAETAARRARDDVARLEASRAQSLAQLADYTIRATASGRLLTRPVDPGQVVSTLTVLFEIAAGDAYEVETDIDETYAQTLAVGMTAKLLPAGLQRAPELAKIVFVSPRVDVATGGRTVRLAFDNLQTGLPPGLTVDVNILVETLDSALTVPRAAIGDPGGQPFVLRQTGGMFERAPIVFVDWPADRVTVSSGLSEGDIIASIASAADPASIRISDVLPRGMGQ
jgi:RND family efflux transporter MFP subunit